MAELEMSVRSPSDSPRAERTAERAPVQRNLWQTSDCHRVTFFWLAIIWQTGMVVLYAILTDYSNLGKARKVGSAAAQAEAQKEIDHLYPFYQDVHVMMFVGFGFLMTFLHKYGFSAVGYNFLIAAFTIQWSILVNGFFDGAWNEFEPTCSPLGDELANDNADSRFCIQIDMQSLIVADFNAAAVLISFGALLGKTNPTQMLIVAILEIIFMAINENIAFDEFEIADMGGSIVVHTFGAYFGLACSWVISSSKNGPKGVSGFVDDRPDNSSRYKSDLFSMLGTIFLWMYWPSFNGALATDDGQLRAMVNTVLSLSACCVTAFFVDNLIRPEHKFNMVSIQNATLAGGVAVGASADLVIQPWGAVLIGMFAGGLSVIGYVKIQPLLATIGLDDTCGVNNLHGMPGILGAIASACAAVAATDKLYGDNVGAVFSARKGDDGRTAGDQAWFQLSALVVTIIISIVGGVVTGFVIKLPHLQFTGKLKNNEEAEKSSICNLCHSGDTKVWYDDSYYWDVPDEEEGTSSSSSSESSED